MIAAQHNLSHAALNSVLLLLKDVNQPVPADARTLMGTSREPLMSQTFHHINDGLEKGIRMQLRTGFNVANREIELEGSADGMPVFKSPPTGFWPISCRVLGSNDPEPFLCSVYCGPSKPPNLDDYLNPFLKDILLLQQEGLEFEGEHYRVNLRRMICDIPAKSLLKCSKGHSGKSIKLLPTNIGPISVFNVYTQKI